MKVTAAHKFKHSLDSVHRAFKDPQFYVEKFEALGNRNVKIIDSGDDEDGFWVEIHREVQLDAPAVLRSLLGEWSEMTQSEHWIEDGDGYSNALDLNSDKVPIKIDGTMRLHGDDKQCTNDVEMQIKSNIPLLGGKLEKFAAKSTEQSLDEEYAFVCDYLKRNAAKSGKKKAKKKAGKKKVSKK